jgi:hypothetical protein
MNLKNRISWIMTQMQAKLFPHLTEVLTNPITEKQERLITILEVVEIDRYVKSHRYQWIGRKLKDRYARGAFI